MLDLIIACIYLLLCALVLATFALKHGEYSSYRLNFFTKAVLLSMPIYLIVKAYILPVL
jgi:hypothetical protein